VMISCLRRDIPTITKQLQLKVISVDYCDFVVWKEDDIILQRILLDSDCIANATFR